MGKRMVMKCCRNVNGGRMYVRQNGKPLEEMGFKYLGPEVAGCGM